MSVARSLRKPRVYAVKCRKTGNTYVGGSAYYNQRKSRHLSDLRKGRHPSRVLQADFNAHGESTIEFVELETVEGGKEALIAAEQRWMDRLQPSCNTTDARGYGREETDEQREARVQAIRDWHAGNKKTPVSQSTREKISMARLGSTRQFTDEHKANLSKSAKGRKLSDDSKRKISEGNKGRKREFTQAHKDAIKLAWEKRKGNTICATNTRK